MKTAKQLERYFKGSANHWRIDILLLISKMNGLSLDQIARELNCHFKTISEHTRRLVQAGLLEKNYRGRRVCHSLTPYGQSFVKFFKSFS